MADDLSREDLIRFYFGLGLSQKDIVFVLAQRHTILISLRHTQRILKALGLTRRKNFTSEIVLFNFVAEQLNSTGSIRGYRMMYQKCIECGINARKEDVRIALGILDPIGVMERRSRRLMRRMYYARGPNYIWHLDSYDKLKPFGLCVNGCIDGYSRKMLWLNAYNTSSDPRIIGGYYMECVQEQKCCPVTIRADKGTENSLVRDLQLYLRNGTERSFMYGRSTANQRIESWWSFLRKELVEYWLSILHWIKNEGDFDGGQLDKELVLFCFLVVLQDELDSVASMWNNHIIRPSRNNRVPHGRPVAMYVAPELHGAEDFACHVLDRDIAIGNGQCIFRERIPCDEELFRLCSRIMNDQNLAYPKNVHEAAHLYLTLREIILSLV